MINHAIKLTQKSDHKTHKHSTIILKGGRIIGQGFNHGWMHSERAAVLSIPIKGNIRRNTPEYQSALKSKLHGSTFINVMVTKTGRLGKSRPCENCWFILKKREIRKVIYFDGNSWVTEKIKYV